MPHSYRFRVPYSETDQMGVVRNSVYLDWLSTARIEALRDQGYSYRDFERDGILLPVISAELRFISPARFDDEIEILTRLVGVKKLKLDFEFQIYKLDDSSKIKLTDAKVILGALNKDFVPSPLPEKILDTLKSRVERIES